MKKISSGIKIFLILHIFIYHNPLPGADSGAINRHGIQLGKKRIYNEAIKEFNRAITNYDKLSAQVYHNKGWTLELMGNYKGAINNYAEAFRRFPKQIASGERLGFLYYKTADYINAVKTGELVLKLDPKNKEIPKWLPDAYLKRLKQQQELLAAKKKKEEEERKRKEESEKKEKDLKEKEKQKLLATFDFMIRTGYYFSGNKGYRYVSDPGIINVPETLYVSFTPTPKWEFDMLLENPFLGATSPNLLIQTEKFEGIYKLDEFMLGIGFMFNQHKSDVAFQGAYGTLDLWDFKTGIIFGYSKDKLEMRLLYYPRLLPYDGKTSSDQTLDVGTFELQYKYKVNSKLQYYSIISAKDYYLFDHDLGVSDYWGVYEIGIGVTLGYIDRDTNKMDIAFTIEFIERFYLRDLNNDNPYTRKPNGQGYFGMTSGKWLKGNPFQGYRGSSHQISGKIHEKINKNFFLYQKLIIELADLNEDHHEFNLQLGVGFIL